MKTKKYIRNKKNQRVGVMVAVEQGDRYAIGVSLCATTRGDRFDPKLGQEVATIRAVKSLNEGVSRPVPQSVEDQYAYYRGECERYYKGDKTILA